MRIKQIVLSGLWLILISTQSFVLADSPWKNIDEGIAVAAFAGPDVEDDHKITVIRIKPERVEIKLLTASEMDHPNLTAQEWAEKYNLNGVINAGMFQTDYKSNVGYMKNFSHINNGYVNRSYQSVAVFNPKQEGKPKFRVVDIDEENVKTLIGDYHSVIQNLRLIKSPAENRWSKQAREWSEVALGQDKAGNALFIFSRKPYSMHTFNEILIKLPIDLVNAQHLEGGPEASLYFNHKGYLIEAAGSYETGFNEKLDNHTFWPIPNVIGITIK